MTVEFLTRLFNNSLLLEKYNYGQVVQGLSYLVSDSEHMICLYSPDVSKQMRDSCIESIYVLFKEYFAKPCENNYQRSLFREVCYMWWDIFPYTYRKGKSQILEIEMKLIEVMSKILTIDSLCCQESALHGLGHWQENFPKRVEEIIDTFLTNNSKIDSELKEYAMKARVGEIV